MIAINVMTKKLQKYLWNKRWSERNPHKNWTKLHRTEAVLRLQKWRRENPEAAKACRVRASNNLRNRLKSLKESFGGRCKVCGYNRCMAALEFHHIDPKTKLFTISGSKAPWSEIVEESKKCVLLCSNCHREVEEGFIEL